MIRRPPRSTLDRSSAASDVYKRQLLELAEKNLFYYCAQKKRDEANKVKKQSSEERILNTLKTDLNMTHLPMHIECFDNSNIQGAFPVSSCAVSYTHLRAHETVLDLVCRLLLDKKKNENT